MTDEYSSSESEADPAMSQSGPPPPSYSSVVDADVVS